MGLVLLLSTCLPRINSVVMLLPSIFMLLPSSFYSRAYSHIQQTICNFGQSKSELNQPNQSVVRFGLVLNDLGPFDCVNLIQN